MPARGTRPSAATAPAMPRASRLNALAHQTASLAFLLVARTLKFTARVFAENPRSVACGRFAEMLLGRCGWCPAVCFSRKANLASGCEDA
jgi:hypothetical protein